MNILEFLKNGSKIKKALWGTNLDVDNRSDTTRQGSGTMSDSAYGAADAPNTGGVLSLLDTFNTVKDTGPRNVTLSNGKQITIPGVLTGVAPTTGSIRPFELSRTASKGERVWKYLFDYVKKHPNVVEPTAPTISKGMTVGNEIGYGLIKLPLEGLTIRNNTPLTLENRVMNPAEKAAAKDYLASRNPKDFEEFPDVIVNTKLPAGRPTGDYKYPQEVLDKYGLKLPKKVEVSKPKKTSSLRSKEYYSKKKEDRNNGVSKVRSRLILNNKAQTTGDMRAANTGRPRRAARYTDLKTELEKDKGFWGKQYNIIRRKIALGKQGAESKEKEFLESYWNYKQKGILNKKQNGGLLELLKNGSGIHIKEKNKGSFTRWCGGNVTEECIRKGKASSNPKIRRKATFADNARHFKHRSGGLIVQEFKLRKMLNDIIND